MNRSESIANLAAALSEAQAEFPAIPRNKEVVVTGQKGSYKFKYAPFEDILRATKDTRVKHGLGFTQGMDGDRMETVILHKSGEWLSHYTPVVIQNAGAQAIGSAITYAKRYGYCAAFGIQADDDDDGNAADGNHIQEAKKPVTASGTMTDVYETLTVDEKTWIDDLAAGVKSWIEKGDGQGALDELDAAIPYHPRPNSKDSEYKLALQSRLGSKVGSALKKARDEQLKRAA